MKRTGNAIFAAVVSAGLATAALAAATEFGTSDKITVAEMTWLSASTLAYVISVWRRGWDSNPRYASVHALSKRAPSTTRPPLLESVRHVMTAPAILQRWS